MGLYYNVTGSTGLTTELIKPGLAYVVASLTVANVHDTSGATVSLFIQDDPDSGTTNTYNIIYKVNVPPSTTLVLDNKSMFLYGNSYGLYIEVGSSDTVDVVVSRGK
tara:strand:- start:183 stop:503 length:321 start_codon:yes stop_codon:yes gene_type:complete